MKNNNLNNLIKYGTLQLDSWCVIGVYGDAEKVVDLLQGQVTSDINKIDVDGFQLSSICNHKGLVMADFIINKSKEGFSFVVKKSISSTLINELTPFAKFNSVTFEEKNIKVMGLISDVNEKLKAFAKNEDFSTYVYMSDNKTSPDSTISNENWEAGNKILGNYFIEPEDIGKFRPLELNYDKLRVSFDKGCYRGQEIVARMKYLGVDRRRFLTFITTSEYDANENIKVIGKIIKIEDKLTFNGIVKKDLIPEIQKNPHMLKII